MNSLTIIMSVTVPVYIPPLGIVLLIVLDFVCLSVYWRINMLLTCAVDIISGGLTRCNSIEGTKSTTFRLRQGCAKAENRSRCEMVKLRSTFISKHSKGAILPDRCYPSDLLLLAIATFCEIISHGP